MSFDPLLHGPRPRRGPTHSSFRGTVECSRSREVLRTGFDPYSAVEPEICNTAARTQCAVTTAVLSLSAGRDARAGAQACQPRGKNSLLYNDCGLRFGWYLSSLSRLSVCSFTSALAEQMRTELIFHSKWIWRSVPGVLVKGNTVLYSAELTKFPNHRMSQNFSHQNTFVVVRYRTNLSKAIGKLLTEAGKGEICLLTSSSVKVYQIKLKLLTKITPDLKLGKIKRAAWNQHFTVLKQF